MVTERGTIKTDYLQCERAEKQYSGKIYILCLVCLIVGCIGMAAYVTVDMLSVFSITPEPPIWILIIVAVPFTFGLIFVITLRKAYKQSRKGNKCDNYEFFGDCVVVDHFENGEKTAELKIYYTQVIKRKESKDYLFATSQTLTVIAVEKAKLSEEEAETLRILFFLPHGNGKTVELKSSSAVLNGANGQTEQKEEPPTDVAED